MLQAPIFTSRDERVEQVSTLHSGYSKSSAKPVLENKEQLWPIYAVLLKDFCADEILPLKFK